MSLIGWIAENWLLVTASTVAAAGLLGFWVNVLRVRELSAKLRLLEREPGDESRRIHEPSDEDRRRFSRDRTLYHSDDLLASTGSPVEQKPREAADELMMIFTGPIPGEARSPGSATMRRAEDLVDSLELTVRESDELRDSLGFLKQVVRSIQRIPRAKRSKEVYQIYMRVSNLVKTLKTATDFPEQERDL